MSFRAAGAARNPGILYYVGESNNLVFETFRDCFIICYFATQNKLQVE